MKVLGGSFHCQKLSSSSSERCRWRGGLMDRVVGMLRKKCRFSVLTCQCTLTDKKSSAAVTYFIEGLLCVKSKLFFCRALCSFCFAKCVSYFLTFSDWCVCVCLNVYARTHTHTNTHHCFPLMNIDLISLCPQPIFYQWTHTHNFFSHEHWFLSIRSQYSCNEHSTTCEGEWVEATRTEWPLSWMVSWKRYWLDLTQP